jgi:hypothetical protein
MRALRALFVASVVACAVSAVVIGPDARVAGAQQLGAVTVDRDGWWDRATDPARPPTSPGLPFPVPANALAVSASGGEPDKVAAVGMILDVDPDRFQRLILHLKETGDPGANVGTNAAGIQACAITGPWGSVKDGAWANRPAAESSGCVAGARSSEGVWSFDITPFAKRWLDGSLAPNGVLLAETVNPPVTFQVAWGDRTGTTMSFSLDVLPGDETDSGDTEFDDASTTSDSGASDDTASDESFEEPAADTFEYSGADAFTVPTPTPAAAPVAPATPELVAPTASNTGVPAATRPTKGKLPLATLLLIPIALGLALALSATLAPDGGGFTPAAGGRREGGVSRALRDRKDQED